MMRSTEKVSESSGADPVSTSLGDFLDSWEGRVFATPQHRRSVDALINLYRDQGLLPSGRDVSLNCSCPNSQKCWAGAPAPNDLANSGIALPWIGRHYFDTRVLILGMNFNNFGGLAGHYEVCEDHIRSMGAGKPGKNGESFSRGAMQYLRVVLASLDRHDLSLDQAEVANETLGPLWERCAYVQTIKCAPGTERSNPTQAMVDTRPGFLLQKELGVLRPSVILLLGRTDLRDVVRPWLVPEAGYGREEGPRLERNRALVDGQDVTLISLNHPSGRNRRHFYESLDQLVVSLRDEPLH